MQKLVSFTFGLIGLLLVLTAFPALVEAQTSGGPRLYSSMTREQRIEFIRSQIDGIIGTGPTDASILGSDEAVMRMIDVYVARKPYRASGCRMGADLNTIFRRAKPHVPAISTSFSLPGVQPDIGIYVAWTESEFCPCIQSPTGTLGMFQFSAALARRYGIEAVSGASPAKPDERCNVKAASRGVALYFSDLLKNDFADDPQEILLAVAAYSIGDGKLRTLRQESREALKRKDIGFWELSDFVLNKRMEWLEEKQAASTADVLDAETDPGRTFQMETFRYVPKFLAAAIIGRNPRTFGVNAAPLSTSD